MVSLSQYQGQQQKRIDAKLAEVVDSYKDFLPPLHEALHYAVFSGGKRIRPLLVIAAAEAVGGTVEDALPAAAAVELLHTYTLVHDDLPAMDDDELRRGQPTVHVKFGEANGILVGDALQALAFETLASMPQAPDLVRELGQAGVRVVGGQWQDMAASPDSVGEKDIAFIHEYKTANLLRTAVRMGGIIGGATHPQLTTLTEYGTALGHLFQLVDDVLDAGEDEKPTAVSVYGLEETKNKAAAYLKQATTSVSGLSQSDMLVALAALIGERIQ